MNKDQLEDYLHNKFNLVLSNENKKDIYLKNVNTLGFYEGSPEALAFVKVATFITQNEQKNNLFFILYDGKYGMRYKASNKNIVFYNENNSKRINKFSFPFLYYIKSSLTKSNNFVVFYTNGNVDVDIKHGMKNHILIVNENTMSEALEKFFDIKAK
ncbi:MAG: hypothetical protein KFW07_00390 [Mycoplasmataceae bacterium]|nr:hypothetical protein [Mycoplasmataceae bacterium]